MPTPKTCPHCRTRVIGVTDPESGTVQCPTCGGALRAGKPVNELPEVLPVEEEHPEVIPVEEAETPLRSSQPRGQRTGERTSGTPSLLESWTLWFVRHQFAKLLVLLLVAPLGGVALILVQLQEAAALRGSGAEPKVISCRDLLNDGPGNTHYIELTDFRLEINRRTTDSLLLQDSWKKAWVPVAPADAPGAQPVRLLLETELATTPDALKRLQQDNYIRGVLVQDIEYLHIGEILRLHMAYSADTDWKHCWVLRHGQVPPSPWYIGFLIGLGILLILAGIPLWWFAWQVWRAGRARPSRRAGPSSTTPARG